ncbi:putative phage abortive infection protein [Acinetobacter baumannii]|uniref:putative phage abortive infection protein n=1 Tax=Acinetobacter baumannii TaxID=470 RepID=UPI0025A1719D|nr:putative phage abortive infection protein [Acinetobacter baumannii]MDO7468738.1 putative phage abortive infection protein [Acinetobacter baumannii]
MLLFILYGLIACLLVYIKYHVDLKFIPNERKWYEKIRFILPIFLLPIFFSIYYFWDHYPEQLIKKDTQIEMPANPNTGNISWPLSTSIIYSTPQDIEAPRTKFQEIGEKYGTYGDTYGSLNTLFTGLAFAGLIISIFIQLLELRQTRKELAAQSKALSDQRTEFAAQTLILDKQTKINTTQQKIINDQFKENQKTNLLNHFFKLIDQKNLLMNDLKFPKNGEVILGQSVFLEYMYEFKRLGREFDPDNHDADYFFKCWEAFTYKSHGSRNYQLISYFKIYMIIFHTLEISNAINEKERMHYANTLRMMTSVEEQIVLMWVSLFFGVNRKYCNKYHLLQGIYNDEFSKIGVEFYEASAFNSKKWNKVFEEHVKE